MSPPFRSHLLLPLLLALSTGCSTVAGAVVWPVQKTAGLAFDLTEYTAKTAISLAAGTAEHTVKTALTATVGTVGAVSQTAARRTTDAVFDAGLEEIMREAVLASTEAGTVPVVDDVIEEVLRRRR